MVQPSFRHPLRILLAATVLTGFLFLGLAIGDAGAQANPPPVKASAVLAAAQQYLGTPYVFGGFGPDGFDCSGYVSRVWNIPRRTTENIGDMANPIGKDDLAPGDALNLPAALDRDGVGHMRIFDKWANSDRSLLWIYEAGETHIVHRVAAWDARYTALRRINFEADVAMPPPPPLPANWNRPAAPPAPAPTPRPKPPAAIAGRMVDGKTGEPLAGARVFYWPARDEYEVRSVTTAGDGAYRVEKLEHAIYEVAVRAASHDLSFRGGLDLREGGTATVDLTLARAAGAAKDAETDAAAPIALPLDHALPNGWFFSQTAGRDGITGFAVVDADGVPFWSEVQRLGGIQAVGYPVSRRFHSRGFTVQVMQKGVLQWRPEVGQAWLTNVFDELHEAGKDDWLAAHRSTPRPIDSSIDNGKSWTRVMADRLSFLRPEVAILERYRSAVGDPLMFFGLPTSPVEDMGNHFAVRLQRAVIQLWKVDVPWARAGETTVANGGDVAKEAGLFPREVLAPHRSPLLAGH